MFTKTILWTMLLLFTGGAVVEAGENNPEASYKYYLRIESTVNNIQDKKEIEERAMDSNDDTQQQTEIITSLQTSLRYDKVYNSSIVEGHFPQLNSTDIVYCIHSKNHDTSSDPLDNSSIAESTVVHEVFWKISGTELLESLLSLHKIELMIVTSGNERYFTCELPLDGKYVRLSKYNYAEISNIGVSLTENDGISIAALSEQINVSAADIKVYALLSAGAALELEKSLSEYIEAEKVLACFSAADCSIILAEYDISE